MKLIFSNGDIDTPLEVDDETAYRICEAICLMTMHTMFEGHYMSIEDVAKWLELNDKDIKTIIKLDKLSEGFITIPRSHSHE